MDLIAWRRKQGSSPDAAAVGSNDGAGPGTKTDANPYLSVDPAPSCGEGGGEGAEREGGDALGTDEMGKRLRDKDRSLFERYRCDETQSGHGMR